MEEYYSKDCEKNIKRKPKNKHLNTKQQKKLAMSVIKHIHVEHLEFFEIDNILKKHVLEFNKKFTSII